MPDVLCIDANATALFVRKRVFEVSGYSVLAAGDAETAMRLFAAANIRIVVTDHFLEETTGMELAAEMKKLKPHVPIVILSGAVDPPEGVLHADLFLSKTEPTVTMLQKISELFNR